MRSFRRLVDGWIILEMRIQLYNSFYCKDTSIVKHFYCEVVPLYSSDVQAMGSGGGGRCLFWMKQ